jgi:hypothetical protein
MRWTSLCGLFIVLSLTHAIAAENSKLEFHKSNNQLSIQLDGKSIATYVWNDPEIPRPYFSNVKTRNGIRITRQYPTDPIVNKGNDDHATYHPGIWLAFGDIGGADFWRNQARVRHAGFLEAPATIDGVGHFTVMNEYQFSSKVLVQETCRYTIRSAKKGLLMTSESSFKSTKESIAFGDQEEMGLGIRLATALTVRHGAGRIRNSHGGINEDGTWGKQADWCAYSGKSDEQQIGVLLMPGPKNFRRSWFHSRDYGLLVANPFGRKAMTGPNDTNVSPDSTLINPDVPFSLDFGVYLFDAPLSEDINFDNLYTEYLNISDR